jgi:uncharacterized membrane protein YqiK
MIRIINAETGEVIEREPNAKELKQQEIDDLAEQAKQIKMQAKADAKTAAQAKLAALGLTVGDLQALGL